MRARRWIRAAVAASAAAALLAEAAQAGALRDDVRVAPAAAFPRLTVEDTGGRPLASGSSVAIAPRHLLTACHVLAGAPPGLPIRLTAPPAAGTPPAVEEGRLVEARPEADLCVVETATDHPAIGRRGAPVAVGETLRLIGTPATPQPVVAVGTVRATVAVAGVPLLLTDAPVPPGMSGAGGFDGDGHLVAVATGRWPWTGTAEAVGVLVDLTRLPAAPAAAADGLPPLAAAPPFLTPERHGGAILLALVRSGLARLGGPPATRRLGPWWLTVEEAACRLHLQGEDGATRLYLRLSEEAAAVTVEAEVRHGPLPLARAGAALTAQVLPGGETAGLTAWRLDRLEPTADAWGGRWRGGGAAAERLFGGLVDGGGGGADGAVVLGGPPGGDLAVLDAPAAGLGPALLGACLKGR
jgi:hypothetical protein